MPRKRADAFFTEEAIPVETLEESARSEEGRTVVTLQAVIRRDKEGKGELDHVVYEAELGRAEDEVRSIQRDVAERWRGSLVFRHRLGHVRAGETSVFLAVTAPRREDSLYACHHVMDRVRHLPGLRKTDVFRDGTSRVTQVRHETLLLSDDAFSLPQS